MHPDPKDWRPFIMSAQPINYHWVTAQHREDGDSPSGALFPYWSFTKTAISICALKLVERSELSLDGHLPNRPFTLRQCPSSGFLEAMAA